MDLTRCSNGHFYDAERFGSCPYCKGEKTEFTETVPYEVDDAVRKEFPNLDDAIYETEARDNEKTISFYNQAIGTKPVVGWLVCIEGIHFGEDFRLTWGKNFIGRSVEMDVALTGENSISREKHAIILYEPRDNVFMVQPGESRELFYLNDKVVLQAEVIQAYDILSVGETKLMFVPFCGEKYKWDDGKKSTEEE